MLVTFTSEVHVQEVTKLSATNSIQSAVLYCVACHRTARTSRVVYSLLLLLVDL
jgi:cytochrome c553